MQISKNELKNIVTLVRGYGHRLLKGIKTGNLTWIPPKTQGKPILYYFAHILNAEIYWLKHMEENSLEYIGEKATFNDGINMYTKLQEFLLEKIKNATKEDLELIIPVFENKIATKVGSLAWMIWRTSMHAVHHFAQIAYIRYALNNPPEDDDGHSWSKVMDQLVRLAHSEL